MTIASDIVAVVPSEPTMAMIHTTTVDLFRVICGNDSLTPQTCPVMHTDLTYFFYGRPAYRPGPISTTNTNLDSRPVIMLFRRGAIHAQGIYPCDTGAHDRKFYSPYLDGITFDDLDCITVANADKRLVTRYFESNERYFYGEVREVLNPLPLSSVAKKYHALLTSTDSTDCDDRSRTIELTNNAVIDLSKMLEQVILPDFLLADGHVAPVVNRWKSDGIVIRHYRPQRLTNAGRTVEQLFPVVGSLQGVPS